MKLGIITDEVSQDPEVFFRFIRDYGLEAMELRSVYGKNIAELSEKELSSIKKMADEAHIAITSLASPVFKCDMKDPEQVGEHIEMFRHLCDTAHFLGTRYIRGFDFHENNSTLTERREKFAPILRIAEENDVVYALEFDPSVNSSTAAKTAAMVKAVDSPYFRAVYDAGNELWVDHEAKPYPDGYELLRPYTVHIHVKDAEVVDGKTEAVKIGSGRVDFKGLFRRLIADGYGGAVMLETHYRLTEKMSEEQLKNPGGNAFSLSGEAASRESMAALLEILNEVRRA